MTKELWKRSLLATTIIGGMAFAQPAFAQDVQTDETDADAVAQDVPAVSDEVIDDVSGDEGAIVITGSRIQSPNIVSLQPVQVFTEQAIESTGAVNVQEVLLENPVFGTPGLARTNSAFLTSGSGVATVDLRDLGSDRTLVLVNSRRMVAGLPGTATVDLNVIPTQFIDRIDILTGGASSLYGSDAVAGVVNMIYKRDIEGVSLDAQYDITERGDAEEYQISLTAGGNFDDGRGNLAVHFGYSDQGQLLSRERENTQIDGLSAIYFNGTAESYFDEVEPFFSSFVPQGRFDVNGTAGSGDDYTYGTDGTLQPCFSTNGVPSCTNFAGNPATGPNGFNRQFFRTLAVPVERYLVATMGHWELTPEVEFFLEGTYAKTKASRQIEPFPSASDDIYPSGRIPLETMVDGQIVVNPLVPQEIVDASSDNDGDGLRDYGYTRRLVEVGPRSGDVSRDTFRIVAGLQGTVLDERFNWDVAYNYGETSELQRSNGQFNVINARLALQGIPDTNDVDNDGDTTDVVCADPVAVAQGCSPLSFFGIGSITPEALAWIDAGSQLTSTITQQTLSANLSGEVVDLPAGPLGIAIGGEYRRESSDENWDALTNAGLNAGNATPDTAGDFDVTEVYGEINVPILADMPGVYGLNVRAAGRISDYSTVGQVETWSVGADYSPIEDIRIRGTYAQAVRAPNIGELFTGPSQTFPSGIIDPCAGVTTSDSGTLAANCLADPGVLANAQANGGVFTQTQSDIQGISGFNVGNPNLGVETSKSLTAGIVVNPRSIPGLGGLVLSVDYYDIEIEDAVAAPPRNFILTQCYEQSDPFFCDLITRRAVDTGSNSAGSIEFIDAPLLNSGFISTRGIDTVVQYSTDLDGLINGWDLAARVAWTHLLEWDFQPTPVADIDPALGEVGNARNRVSSFLGVSDENWGFSLTGFYIGTSYEDDQFLAAFGLEPESVEFDPEFYLDAQLSYKPLPDYEFYVGVDNLLDNDAPLILTGTTFNATGTDSAPDVYDIFGRRYYAGIRFSF